MPSTWEPIAFATLPGWQDDRQSEALGAFVQSCGVQGTRDPWRNVCAAAAEVPPGDDCAARTFFETWFTPYALDPPEDGLFTGYYEPLLQGSRTRHGRYQTPLWGVPRDLASGSERRDSYDDRAAIARGSLHGRAKPLVWVDDPIAAFFLEVQGSGRVKLDTGATVRLGYAAQNGHPYVSIGRALADAGAIDRPVTMDKIIAWLRAHPAERQDVLDLNPSVVFFRVVDTPPNVGPLGAQGVPLTPGRSVAVDPSWPLGTPLWLRLGDGRPWPESSRLVIAQDRGGAIRGRIRGDIFLGTGPEAGALAGVLQARGGYVKLVPRI